MPRSGGNQLDISQLGSGHPQSQESLNFGSVSGSSQTPLPQGMLEASTTSTAVVGLQLGLRHYLRS